MRLSLYRHCVSGLSRTRSRMVLRQHHNYVVLLAFAGVFSFILLSAHKSQYPAQYLAKGRTVRKMDVSDDKISQSPDVGGLKNEVESILNDLITINSQNLMRRALSVLRWDGHGQEKGMYNFTVVTAMMDIGRGSWAAQTRSYFEYLTNMRRVLELDVNFVCFVDRKATPLVRWMRRSREKRTKIFTMEFSQLPYYKHKEEFTTIMRSDEYKQDNELYANYLAEALHPEYNILQLSKLYFMDRAVRENPFNTTYFMWLDGGYGHGNDVHPADHIWRPRNLFNHPDQVTMIEMGQGVEHYSNLKHRIQKLRIAVIAGLFFGGGGHVFRELYQMQLEEVDRWLKEGICDDDQTMYMLLYYRKPQLFHLVRGTWYDVFKRFHYERFNIQRRIVGR